MGSGNLYLRQAGQKNNLVVGGLIYEIRSARHKKGMYFILFYSIHIHGAKSTKNQTLLVRFARLFYNQTVFQKSV